MSATLLSNPRTRGTIIVPFPSGVAVFQDPSEGLAKAATIAVLVRIPSDKQYYLPAEESLGQYQIMSYWQAMQSSYSEELVVAGACRCLPEMMKIQFGETTHVSALTLEGKSMPRQTCPTSPLDSCCPCHMDRLEVQVLKSNGEVTSLCLADGEGVKEVLQSLGEGGYVVLKEATDLRVSPGSTEIRSNRFVHTILTAQNGNFVVTGYRAHTVGPEQRELGRDKEWKELAKDFEPIGLSCMHLGGDKNINWIIEIDQGLRGEATGKMETILATGRDIFLCNAWLQRTNPRPLIQPHTKADLIAIKYLRQDFLGSS